MNETGGNDNELRIPVRSDALLMGGYSRPGLWSPARALYFRVNVFYSANNSSGILIMQIPFPSSKTLRIEMNNMQIKFARDSRKFLKK